MGLSLHESWRLSPRSLRLVSKARHDARLDEMDQRVIAAYAGEYFHRQKRLDGRVLKKMMPKRSGVKREHVMTAEEAIKLHDAWATGINLRVAAGKA